MPSFLTTSGSRWIRVMEKCGCIAREHRIFGVHQRECGSGRTLTFTSQEGEVELSALKLAESE